MFINFGNVCSSQECTRSAKISQDLWWRQTNQLVIPVPIILYDVLRYTHNDNSLMIPRHLRTISGGRGGGGRGGEGGGTIFIYVYIFTILLQTCLDFEIFMF